MTTPLTSVDAPLHVTLERSTKGRAYYIHHCCGKRYVNLQQLMRHRCRVHDNTTREAEDLCRDAYAACGFSSSLPQRREYIRTVCTCGAGRPECPACIEWRHWFGGHPSIPETHRSYGHDGPMDVSELQARLRAATNALKLAAQDGDLLEATKQRRRMAQYTAALTRLRLGRA